MTTDFSSLDRHRAHLESTLSDLQHALYTWRNWEAEYDGLKAALGEPDATGAGDDQEAETEGDGGEGEEERDLLEAALEYIAPLSPATTTGSDTASSSAIKSGNLLSREEVEDLVCGTTQAQRSVGGPKIYDKNSGHGHGRGGSGHRERTRTREQIVSLIDRRIDYVRENVRVLEGRVEDAQAKLERLVGDLAVEDDEGQDTGGDAQNGDGSSGQAKKPLIPVTEIVEELDEEGNVVSGETVRAGDGAKEVLEMLQKAGVKMDEKEEKKKELEQEKVEEIVEEVDEAEEDGQDTVQTPTTSGSDMGSSISNEATDGSSKATPQEASEDGEKTNEMGESPEDAALRREMVRYSLDQVGSVVAELELDESGSEFSVDDDEDFMSDDDDDDDDEEDEYGRTTRRVLDDDYHRQMRELEKKLNAASLHNIGPDTGALPDDVQRELDSGSVAQVAADTPGPKASSMRKKGAKKEKKRVAFADDLEIASDTTAPRTPAATAEPAQKKKAVEPPAATPIQDQIVERSERDRSHGNSGPVQSTKKVSRFKSARQAQESTPNPTPGPSSTTPTSLERVQPQEQQQHATGIPLFPARPTEPKPFSQPIIDPEEQQQPPPRPSPPTTKILSDTLLERQPSPSTATAASAPPDPDDFDETLHSRQIATEYYQMRNRKIQVEGGFVSSGPEEEEEDELVPVDEGGKRVSRFKAARAKNGNV